MNSLEQTDAASAAVQVTPNRVTLESLKAKIVSEEYTNPPTVAHMTIAVLTTRNGFTLVGKSAPADPANFNPELGQRFAYEDALRQLWRLEGYLLCERLFNEKTRLEQEAANAPPDETESTADQVA